MITLLLTGVFYTHLWVNNRNTFVKICRYDAPEYRSVDDYAIWTHDRSQCPPTVTVKNK